VLRVIGRLAFPLFAYLLVLGVENTRSVRNYFMRLLIFAFISQVPFYLALGLEPFESLNVFFTLASGVLFIYFCKKNSLLALLPFFASIFSNFDYGVYGIALIGCMYILERDAKMGVLSTVLLNLLFLPIGSYQIFSLIALPVILLHKNGYLRIQKEISRGTAYPAWRKYLFYIYYPAHLILLYLINLNH
jgi:hypothetical protein